ncbi:MAG: hypothetical protein IPL38_06645 [Rhodobacter sp.]|nr:hypothetical protein [Rhodobacter sp.]
MAWIIATLIFVAADDRRRCVYLALCVLALPMMAVGTRRLADAGVWRWLSC